MITEVKTKVYAGRLKDNDSLLRSSSGGAFVAVSDYFLDNGDAVVCAVYTYESHVTEFQLIESKERRNEAIGSKLSIPDDSEQSFRKHSTVIPL